MQSRDAAGLGRAGAGAAAGGSEKAGKQGGQRASKAPDQARLERLAAFQEAALRDALTLPNLARLVYSTCSLHARENEAVVAAVLPEYEQRGFALADPFPGWHRRGLPGSVAGAEKLVRVDPIEDGTDGFFLAVFVKATDRTSRLLKRS
jgi:putative methyltransferase